MTIYLFKYVLTSQGRVDQGSYRRSGEPDGDAYFGADGAWHYTPRIALAEEGLDDSDFREVPREEMVERFRTRYGTEKLVDTPVVPPSDHVVTEREALDIARNALAQLEEKIGSPIALYDGAFGMPSIENRGDVWVANWNSAAYIRSGDFRDQVLSGAIAVPKNGDPFLVLPTWGSTEEVLDSWREERAVAGR